MYIFGEIQLLATELLIVAIHLVDLQIKSSQDIIISQSHIQNKLVIGWLIVCIFIAQNLLVLAYVSLNVVPKFISVFNQLVSRQLQMICRQTIYLSFFVPIQFYFMKNYPYLSSLTRRNPKFLPVVQKISLFTKAVA